MNSISDNVVRRLCELFAQDAETLSVSELRRKCELQFAEQQRELRFDLCGIEWHRAVQPRHESLEINPAALVTADFVFKDLRSTHESTKSLFQKLTVVVIDE